MKNSITFSDVKRNYKIQCLRKTYQGYYAVFLLDDGRNASAFFNNENKLTDVLITDGFKSKEEFTTFLENNNTESAVLKQDPNTILFPTSAVDVTAHIVQEGVLIITYSRFSNGTIIDDPTVSSVDFIETEKIMTCEDHLIKYEIPYIIELDKVT